MRRNTFGFQNECKTNPICASKRERVDHKIASMSTDIHDDAFLHSKSNCNESNLMRSMMTIDTETPHSVHSHSAF